MIIQVVNFNLKDLSDADYRSACDGLAPELARVPGLISKVWLADEPRTRMAACTRGPTSTHWTPSHGATSSRRS